IVYGLHVPRIAVVERCDLHARAVFGPARFDPRDRSFVAAAKSALIIQHHRLHSRGRACVRVFRIGRFRPPEGRESMWSAWSAYEEPLQAWPGGVLHAPMSEDVRR